jgi:hypothetical protein
VVICVFRDSLNYSHIARRVRGATKQRESIIRGMEIAERPTGPHSRLWILQVVGFHGETVLLQAGL